MLSRKRGIIEQIKARITMKGFMTVKAEEPTTPTEGDTTPTTPQATINYEDLIARARREEKDKLYPKIQKLEADNTSLVEKHNKALLDLEAKNLEVAKLKSEIESLKTASKESDSETVKTLKSEIKELKKELKEYETKIVDPEAIRNEVVAEYEVKLYKEQKLREVGDNIIPELVFGSTKEEIDQSLEVAKNRYQAIIGKIATPSIPPVNVNTGSMNSKEIRTEDISKMSPTEWAEYRKKLGLR